MSDRLLIGNALYILRAYSGLTQKEMADLLDIPQSSISAFESGKRTPSIENLEIYSEKLGISVSNLVFFAEHLSSKPFSKGKMFIAESTLKLLEKLIGKKSLKT